MEDAKIYGLCLSRLRHQIKLADARPGQDGPIQLESYFSSTVDEIVDMLELYDIAPATPDGLRERLDELSLTASLLMGRRVIFDYDSNGVLGLYLAAFEPAGVLR